MYASVYFHEIYTSFYANPSLEVSGVFLDISKVFDQVWHEGLIYKIKCMGVKGDLMESFLFERQQRLVLNGQESQWLTIKSRCSLGFDCWSIIFFEIFQRFIR